MSILSGHDKVDKYKKTAEGYKLESQTTYADTVLLNDGQTLEEYLDSPEKKYLTSTDPTIYGGWDETSQETTDPRIVFTHNREHSGVEFVKFLGVNLNNLDLYYQNTSSDKKTSILTEDNYAQKTNLSHLHVSSFYYGNSATSVSFPLPTTEQGKRMIVVFTSKGTIILCVNASGLVSYTSPDGITITYSNSKFTFSGLGWYENTFVIYNY